MPAANPSATADVLMDIYTGKKAVKRALPADRILHSDTPDGDNEGRGGTDPNAVAEEFVRSFDAPMIKIATDEGSTSEDFWTVGNSVRWMLLCAQLLGIPATSDGGNGSEDNEEILRKMGVGMKLLARGEEGGNVWKMVMGDDMRQGEAELK